MEDMEAIGCAGASAQPYFDYEAYGRDIPGSTMMGHYAPGGYVVQQRDHFIEHYPGGMIFQRVSGISMPKLNIREQMAAYKEVETDRAAPERSPFPQKGGAGAITDFGTICPKERGGLTGR